MICVIWRINVRREPAEPELVYEKIDFKRWSLLLVLGFVATILAATDLPKPFTFTRYQPMMDRFAVRAVATAVAAPPTAPNFAKDL